MTINWLSKNPFEVNPRQQRSFGPFFKKGETFAIRKGRERLGVSSSIMGAIQEADRYSARSSVEIYIQGEFTSDGSFWPDHGGRRVAIRERGRWVRLD